jgi:pimeloyl-ACP methyl ester carboxylesterase
MIQHSMVQASGARLHVAQAGEGHSLLLLHGWAEFWFTWEPVMTRLAEGFRVIAPDLRGFGDRDKPNGPFGPEDHALDLSALLDELAIEKIGVVGYDVGGAAMLPLARHAAQRIAGLFFFDFVYPGIGPRMGEPERLKEVWYQSFHLLPIAPVLVGATRETCTAYFGHFLRHWAWRKHAFDEVLEIFVDNFMKPGNLEGGFAHYKGSYAGRMAMMKGQTSALPPIEVPACVRWA